MKPEDLRTELRGLAQRLTDLQRTELRPFSVIQAAHELGLRVSLKMYRRSAGRGAKAPNGDGILEFNNTPEIVLFRASSQATKKTLSPSDEAGLFARERFTIAHEIAHWLAYDKFDVEPEEPGTPVYWQHEKIMHDFAGVLLVPDHLLDLWMASVKPGKLATIHDVAGWVCESSTSMSVVTSRVVGRQPGTGFLKLAIGKEKKRGPKKPAEKVILEVLPNAISNGLDLPNNFARIYNDRLIEVLFSKKIGFEVLMTSTSFDGKKVQNLCVWWREAPLYKGERLQHIETDDVENVFWTSWATPEEVQATVQSGKSNSKQLSF